MPVSPEDVRNHFIKVCERIITHIDKRLLQGELEIIISLDKYPEIQEKLVNQFIINLYISKGWDIQKSNRNLPATTLLFTPKK